MATTKLKDHPFGTRFVYAGDYGRPDAKRMMKVNFEEPPEFGSLVCNLANGVIWFETDELRVVIDEAHDDGTE